MTDQELIDLAVAQGFSGAAVVDPKDIPFEFSFRPYCEENLCGQYGANYSCPPTCGTCEQMRDRILTGKRALVLQSIWEIEDFTDKPVIKKAKGAHNRWSLALAEQLRKAGVPGFVAGASGCALCSPCAMVSGEPCRFPDLRYSCMSAYCIYVKKLADLCGLEYSCPRGLLAFFGMYVCT